MLFCCGAAPRLPENETEHIHRSRYEKTHIGAIGGNNRSLEGLQVCAPIAGKY